MLGSDDGRSVAAEPVLPQSASRASIKRRPYVAALAVVVTALGVAAAGVAVLRHTLETIPPVVAAPDLTSIFFDQTPVAVPFTVGGDRQAPDLTSLFDDTVNRLLQAAK